VSGGGENEGGENEGGGVISGGATSTTPDPTEVSTNESTTPPSSSQGILGLNRTQTIIFGSILGLAVVLCLVVLALGLKKKAPANTSPGAYYGGGADGMAGIGGGGGY
jgi:hypothetical protein